ncbi:NfeD family protein [Marinimicrobium alkaliphilum]|uniref:NfeD family protein n=1 Tax=Marinimicrobium alkaliphilum TaxID=2202654 RepID=UPI000DBA0054|nr:NfeD family protein [Marinimicrobium alkaliphilum]
MPDYALWILIGLVLLISELFAPGLIAIFFGIGALIVGLLVAVGVLDSLASQLVVFSLLSLAALFGLRRQCKRWMHGGVFGRSSKNLDDTGFVGTRVKVLSDFVQGTGTVQLHGAKWDAESDEPLKAGDAAWVLRNKGIQLTVSGQAPQNNEPQ